MTIGGSVRRFAWYHAPFIGWTAIIFVSSSLPSSELPKFVFKLSDKLLHALVFLIFAALAHRSMRHQSRFQWISRNAVLLALVLTVLYGIADEIHQSYVPGRNSTAIDVLADFFGGVVFACWVGVRNMAQRRKADIE